MEEIEGELIPARIEISVKINEVPKAFKIIKNGWYRFIVGDAQPVVMKAMPRFWNKLTKAEEDFSSWVGVITGKFGQPYKKGFVMENPVLQVFEKKPKKPKD